MENGNNTEILKDPFVMDLPHEAENVLTDDWEGDIAPSKCVFPPQLSQLFVHFEVASCCCCLPCHIHLRVVWVDRKPCCTAICEPCQEVWTVRQWL